MRENLVECSWARLFLNRNSPKLESLLIALQLDKHLPSFRSGIEQACSNKVIPAQGKETSARSPFGEPAAGSPQGSCRALCMRSHEMKHLLIVPIMLAAVTTCHAVEFFLTRDDR